MTNEERERFEGFLEKCGISERYASRVASLDALLGLLLAYGVATTELERLIVEEVLHDIAKFAPGHHECKLCFGSGGTVEFIGAPYVPCTNCKPNPDFCATVFHIG